MSLVVEALGHMDGGRAPTWGSPALTLVAEAAQCSCERTPHRMARSGAY
jgi:hypothetical protein